MATRRTLKDLLCPNVECEQSGIPVYPGVLWKKKDTSTLKGSLQKGTLSLTEAGETDDCIKMLCFSLDAHVDRWHWKPEAPNLNTHHQTRHSQI